MTGRGAAIGPKPPMLEHALAYAGHGWAVFPLHSVEAGRCSCGKGNCKRAGKHPRTPKGFKDASTDQAVIRQWWDNSPTANIGIAYRSHVASIRS